MSYFPAEPVVGNSRGINFDMFDNAVLSPMIPQDRYRLTASGPAYLSTDGLGWVSRPVRARKFATAGGDDAADDDERITPAQAGQVATGVGAVGLGALVILGIVLVAFTVGGK